MKKVLTSVCLLLAVCSNGLLGDSSDEIAKYDRYFNEIGEIRVGVSIESIDGMENPFVTAPVQSIAQSGNGTSAPVFKLNAIFENRAKINDTWLTKGSSINGMRVVAIKQRSVVLGSENKAVELFLREKNENSIITTN